MKKFLKFCLWVCVIAVLWQLLKYAVVLALLAGALWLMRRKKVEKANAVPVSDKEFYYDTETGEVFDIPKGTRRKSTVHFE
jgi:hypothetical protein